MEILVFVVVVGAVALLWFYNRDSKSMDLNQDGKTDAQDVRVAVKTAKAGIAADIVRVKTAVKKVAAKKSVSKKTTPKKPAAKKPAAKKPSRNN
jgi:hypothetical protein